MNVVPQGDILRIEIMPIIEPSDVLFRISLRRGSRASVMDYIVAVYQFYASELPYSRWGQIRWSTSIHMGDTIGSTRREHNFDFQEFWDKLDDLTTSKEEIQIMDLIFFVNFVRIIPIRGDCNSITKKSVLKINGGPSGHCLIYSLLIAFRNDHEALGKFSNWKYKKELSPKKMLELMLCNNQVVQSLARFVGVPTFDFEFFNSLISKFPKYLILIFKGGHHKHKYVVRGSQFISERKSAKKYSIFLDEHTNLTCSHVNYILDYRSYISFNETTTNHLFCYDCYKLFPSVAKATSGHLNLGNHIDNHNCLEGKKCVGCHRPDQSCKLIHKSECPTCLGTTRNDECFKIHTEDTTKRYCIVPRTRCGVCCVIVNRRDFKNHKCLDRFCKTCKKILPVIHKCINKKAFSNFRKHQISSKNEIEYLFADIECCTKKSEPIKMTKIDKDNNLRVEYYDQADMHIPNYIYMEDMNGNNWEFNSAKEFIEWALEQNTTSSIRIYFHNGGRYDLRLIFDAWLTMFDTFPFVLWGGQKILKMGLLPWDAELSKGSITLHDSLFHISLPLSGFSKTFNLPITKGFFPHEFHNFENQHYIGTIPDKNLFPKYSGKEKIEFNTWHDNFQGDYNLREEMIKYCKMDVELLRKGCTIYRQAGLDSQVNLRPKLNKIDPFLQLTIAGYCHKIYQEQHYESRTIEDINHKDPFYKLVKDSFHGGDTNSTNLLKELTDEEIARGEKIMYVDKVSMYPDIMVNCILPIGTPKHVIFEEGIVMTNNEILNIFGFIRIDYEVIKYIHHPIPKLLKDKKLCSDLFNQVKVSLTTVEIKAMIESGCYKITKVWEYLHYEKTSADLFKSYMNTCVGGKTLTSHDPTENDEKEASDLYSHTNGAIDIKGKEFKNNPGLRAIYKLMCNSLWGKFGENDDRDKISVFSKETFDMIMEDVMEGFIDIKEKTFHPNNPDLVLLKLSGEHKDKYFKQNDDSKPYQKLRNLGIASFITAYGRSGKNMLGDIKRKLNSRSYYNDTDSIIYHYIPGKYEVPLGNLLGQWSSEIKEKDGFIDKYSSTGPKSYSYRIIYEPEEFDPLKFEIDKHVKRNNFMYKFKQITKTKGIKLDENNLKNINLDSMADLVTGNIMKLNSERLKFEWKRMKTAMRTFVEEKQVSLTYNKGFVNSRYEVLPFGWDKFIYEREGKYYNISDNLLVDI